MKKSMLAILPIVSSLLLVGCSNPSSKKEVEFGDMMNHGKKVFLLLESTSDESKPTKEDRISSFFVTENGKITSYSGSGDVYLEDLKGKSDDEIIKIAKKKDKKNFDNTKKDALDMPNQNVENIKYKKPTPRKIEITVQEDGSGNKTAREEFYITPRELQAEYGTDKYKYDSDKDLRDKSLAFDKGASTTKIYDNNYAYLKNSGDLADSTKSYLITKVSDKTEKSKLDHVGSKYVKTSKN